MVTVVRRVVHQPLGVPSSSSTMESNRMYRSPSMPSISFSSHDRTNRAKLNSFYDDVVRISNKSKRLGTSRVNSAGSSLLPRVSSLISSSGAWEGIGSHHRGSHPNRTFQSVSDERTREPKRLRARESSSSTSSISSFCAGSRPAKSRGKKPRGVCAPFMSFGSSDNAEGSASMAMQRSISNGSSSPDYISLFDVIGRRPLSYQQRVENLNKFFELHAQELVGWQKTRRTLTQSDILGSIERLAPFLYTFSINESTFSSKYPRSMCRKALRKLVNVTLSDLQMSEAHFLYATAREARTTPLALSSQDLWNEFQNVFHLVSIAYTVLLPPFDIHESREHIPLSRNGQSESESFLAQMERGKKMIKPIPVMLSQPSVSPQNTPERMFSPLLISEDAEEERDGSIRVVSRPSPPRTHSADNSPRHSKQGAGSRSKPTSSRALYTSDTRLEEGISISDMHHNLRKFIDKCSTRMAGGHALQSKPVTADVLCAIKDMRWRIAMRIHAKILVASPEMNPQGSLSVANRITSLDFLSLSLDEALAGKAALTALCTPEKNSLDSYGDGSLGSKNVHGLLVCLLDLVSILCMLLRVDVLTPSLQFPEPAAQAIPGLPFVHETLLDSSPNGTGNRENGALLDDAFETVLGDSSLNEAIADYIEILEDIASSGSVKDAQLMRWWIFRKQNGITDRDHRAALRALGWTEEEFDRSLQSRESTGPNFCLLSPATDSKHATRHRETRNVPVSP